MIPGLRRLRQEDCDFQASLGYSARSCPKKAFIIIICSLSLEKNSNQNKWAKEVIIQFTGKDK